MGSRGEMKGFCCCYIDLVLEDFCHSFLVCGEFVSL